MKASTVLAAAAALSSASAFAPSPAGPQSSTQLSESLFGKISNMDLWAPVKDSNEYGARGRKKVKTGELSDNSYVPSGLTKAQYAQIRKEQDTKKRLNYEKNVKKAGIFQDYTDFYTKRGSDEGGNWLKLPNLGHTMAKTKYDWSGETDTAPTWTGVTAKKK